MSVWSKYSTDQQLMYKEFISMYGALSAMFNQKSSLTGAPYLDSKFQETIYARSFHAEPVDIGNTPHDILSVLENRNIGIGIKTWLNSSPSYQKVMQLKRFKKEIDLVAKNDEQLALKLSQIKNEKLRTDYARLGLSENDNIYHYITRDKGKMVLQETAYPLIELNRLQNFKRTDTSFEWTDGFKQYKYTFGDSQIWMLFGNDGDHTILDQVEIDIMQDPFDFLRSAFAKSMNLRVDKGVVVVDKPGKSAQRDDIYLPLYSFKTQKVESKSGLNAWNAASKNKNSNSPRPEAEVYIPVPKQFNNDYPHWFSDDVDSTNYAEFKKQQLLKAKATNIKPKYNIPFTLILPNGESVPALFGQENFKGVQTDPQSKLGNWLLYDVLRLDKGQVVTREILEDRGFDSVRLWHPDISDKTIVSIDFAPVGSFERFMKNDLTDDEYDLDEL